MDTESTLRSPSRCLTCRAWFDSEDLFCHNCGTEVPERLSVQDQAETRNAADRVPSALAFRCEGCGASMNYDASAQSLRCPFCGRTELKQQAAHRTLRPQWVVPLRIDRQQAQQRLHAFLQSSFWYPSDLSTGARIQEMVPLYFPAWAFDAAIQTNFTADSSATPAGARGDWFPVFGSDQSRYRGLLVPASYALTENEVRDIEPFDLAEGVSPDQVDLVNVIVEEFQVPQRTARGMARRAMEHLELHRCGMQVPGSVRNVRVNLLLSEITGRPLLLPVWVLAYSYRDTLYRVLINGQNGKISGKAPWSIWKLTAAALLLFLLLLGLLIVFGTLAVNS